MAIFQSNAELLHFLSVRSVVSVWLADSVSNSLSGSALGDVRFITAGGNQDARPLEAPGPSQGVGHLAPARGEAAAAGVGGWKRCAADAETGAGACTGEVEGEHGRAVPAAAGQRKRESVLISCLCKMRRASFYSVPS
jgi:hypothetical protein